MPTQLTIERHLEGLAEAVRAFVAYAERAGLDAAVPTCPDWTVRDLVAHQGMVHRWATALVRGERPTDEEVAGYEAAGRDAADPLGWLAEGAAALARALSEALADLRTFVFLNDAPPAREFWARRQCHETTIHSVDALAAALGRLPRAEETGITREIAIDGIDELVRGFVTRSRSTLRSDIPVSFSIRPDDVHDAWQVQVSAEPARTTRGRHQHADVVLEGTAVQLYLALWNRTDEIQVDGFDLWRRSARIV